MSATLTTNNAIQPDRREKLAQAFSTACNVALTAGAVASFIYLFLTLASIVVVKPAFSPAAPTGLGAAV